MAVHLADYDRFLERLAADPGRYGTVTFETQREALIRSIDGDPTAPAWHAWARSTDLSDEVAAMLDGERSAGQGCNNG